MSFHTEEAQRQIKQRQAEWFKRNYLRTPPPRPLPSVSTPPVPLKQWVDPSKPYVSISTPAGWSRSGPKGVPSSPFEVEQNRNYSLEKRRESLGLAPPLFLPQLPKDADWADWKLLNDDFEKWMDRAVALGRAPHVKKTPAPTPAATPFAPTAGDYIPGRGRYPQQVIEERKTEEMDKLLKGVIPYAFDKAEAQKQEAEEARQERGDKKWEGLLGEEQRQITLDAALVEAKLSPPPDVPSLFKKKGEVGYEEELKAYNDSIEAWLVKGGLLREQQPVLDPLGTVTGPVGKYVVKPLMKGLDVGAEAAAVWAGTSPYFEQNPESVEALKAGIRGLFYAPGGKPFGESVNILSEQQRARPWEQQLIFGALDPVGWRLGLAPKGIKGAGAALRLAKGFEKGLPPVAWSPPVRAGGLPPLPKPGFAAKEARAAEELGAAAAAGDVTPWRAPTVFTTMAWRQHVEVSEALGRNPMEAVFRNIELSPEQHAKKLADIKATRAAEVAEEAAPVVREGWAVKPGDTVFHGSREGRLESFIDTDGNLVLQPSTNFEGKKVGVSFTGDRATAQDYATRFSVGEAEGAIAARRQHGGFIFEIDRDAIPNKLFPESATQLDTRGTNPVVIPKGRFKVSSVDEKAQSALEAFEREGRTAVRALSDRELGTRDLYSTIQGEVAEAQAGGEYAGWFPYEGLELTQAQWDIAGKFGFEAVVDPLAPWIGREIDRRMVGKSPDELTALFSRLAKGAEDLSPEDRNAPFFGSADFETYFRKAYLTSRAELPPTAERLAAEVAEEAAPAVQAAGEGGAGMFASGQSQLPGAELARSIMDASRKIQREMPRAQEELRRIEARILEGERDAWLRTPRGAKEQASMPVGEQANPLLMLEPRLVAGRWVVAVGFTDIPAENLLKYGFRIADDVPQPPVPNLAYVDVPQIAPTAAQAARVVPAGEGAAARQVVRIGDDVVFEGADGTTGAGKVIGEGTIEINEVSKPYFTIRTATGETVNSPIEVVRLRAAEAAEEAAPTAARAAALTPDEVTELARLKGQLAEVELRMSGRGGGFWKDTPAGRKRTQLLEEIAELEARQVADAPITPTTAQAADVGPAAARLVRTDPPRPPVDVPPRGPGEATLPPSGLEPPSSGLWDRLLFAHLDAPNARDLLRGLAERLDHIPVLRYFAKALNPSAVARENPLRREGLGYNLFEEHFDAQLSQRLARFARENPFDVDKQGRVLVGDKYGRRVAFGDVAENPSGYGLTDQQESWIKDAWDYLDELAINYEEVSGKGLRVFLAREHYWPRFTTDRLGRKGVFAFRRGKKVGAEESPEFSRLIDSMEDGLTFGVRYEASPLAQLEMYGRALNKMARDDIFIDRLYKKGLAKPLASWRRLGARVKADRVLEVNPEEFAQMGERSPVFSKEAYKELRGSMPRPAPLAIKLIEAPTSLARTLVAGAFDVGAFLYQGMPFLVHMPDRFVKAFFGSIRAMGQPHYYPEWVSKNADAKWASDHGVDLGMKHEYFQAAPVLRAIPGVAQVAGAVQRGFDSFIGMGRAYMFRGFSDAAEGEGVDELYRLGRTVNTLLGTPTTKGLGVSSTQRAAESAFLFFSPRYTRSVFGAVAHMFGKGRSAVETRKALSKLLFSGALFYYGLGKAMGKSDEEIRQGLDPRNGKRFMSYEVGGVWFGFGGGYRALLEFLAASADKDSWDFENWSDAAVRNPVTRYMRSRTAPFTGVLSDALLRSDFIGRPFTMEAFTAEPERLVDAVMQRTVPFPLQAIYELRGVGPGAMSAGFGLEMIGGRVSPSTFIDVADRVAVRRGWANYRDLEPYQKDIVEADEAVQKVKDRQQKWGMYAALEKIDNERDAQVDALTELMAAPWIDLGGGDAVRRFDKRWKSIVVSRYFDIIGSAYEDKEDVRIELGVEYGPGETQSERDLFGYYEVAKKLKAEGMDPSFITESQERYLRDLARKEDGVSRAEYVNRNIYLREVPKGILELMSPASRQRRVYAADARERHMKLSRIDR